MARKNIGETVESAVDTMESTKETEVRVLGGKDRIMTTEISFSKQAFLLSKTYKPHKDLLETLLKDGKSYTKTEVNKLIDEYLKRSVK